MKLMPQEFSSLIRYQKFKHYSDNESDIEEYDSDCDFIDT